MTVVRATKLAWIAALFAPAVSCTLLVQFHDQDAGEEAGLPSTDGGVDVTQEAQVEAEVEAEAAAVDNWNPCATKTNGWRCGNNGLDDLLPDADLVYCSGGNIGTLTLCDGGCVHVVDPFPDSCNPCGGATNGNYCGRDLAGFNPDNSDILVTCAGGQVGDQDACAHGCGSNGNMGACFP